MIVFPRIEEYLHQLTPSSSLLLSEMEELAAKENVPIIDRASIHLICSILKYKGQISRILEIGTAIGYSTIWLAQACPTAQVDSVERDEHRYLQAKDYVQKANLKERIHLHLADATEFHEQLKEEYDVIFIDAAKGQYQHFFEAYTKRLKPHGLVITDNVFFHGEVVEENIEQKRIRSLVKKIKAYNEWLKNHERFETSFVPIGDGLAFSILK